MPETGAITFFFALKCEEPKRLSGKKALLSPVPLFSENGVIGSYKRDVLYVKKHHEK